MQTPDRRQALPITFRQALLGQVAAALRAGECCSIIGAGGVGKTNLARFLARPDVQGHYWGGDPVWALLIDSNALAVSGRPAELALLELVMHRLIREAERRGRPPELVAELDRLHGAMVARPDTLLALRYLERAIDRLCREGDLQIVLIFDQFEDIWQRLEARLFLNLRYLRDEFKYSLVYLTITRGRLPGLRQEACADAHAVESFWEMFDAHVFGLGMYDAADAREMVGRIARRQGAEASEELAGLAIAASGGHPALLRAIAWGLARGAAAGDDIAALAAVPAVEAECARLWEDLPAEEQHLVRQLAAGGEPRGDGGALAELRVKEIVRGAPPGLFSPVFAEHVRRQDGPGATGVVVDLRQRAIWVDGRQLDDALTPLEFGLLAHLARHAGQVCPRDEILAALYPDDRQEAASDERIDTLLRRLRESLGEDGRRPRHLFTHRGVGIRLARGGLRE